jgi:hypothetical protein
MAVTVLLRKIAAALEYTHTTDTSADFAAVPNSTYFFNKADNLTYYKDSIGSVLGIFTGGAAPSSGVSGSNTLLSSSQWSRSGIPATPLANGALANGFAFFTDGANKVAGGTTPYNEFFINFTRQFNLTGTSGTGFFTINGNNYPITFNTSLNQTGLDFYTANAVTIFATEGVQVGYSDSTIPGGFVAGVKFGDTTTTILDAITFTNTGGNLNGTFVASVGDHTVVPYIGTPYDGLRIHHIIRINFEIATGNTETYDLSLRRWFNNSQIGSSQQIGRNPDTQGNQIAFASYTAGALDPFVTGGFYVALFNNSGTTATIQGSSGILIQNTFQKPVNFQ